MKIGEVFFLLSLEKSVQIHRCSSNTDNIDNATVDIVLRMNSRSNMQNAAVFAFLILLHFDTAICEPFVACCLLLTNRRQSTDCANVCLSIMLVTNINM